MKNNEIVSAVDIAEFSRLMREARLSFVHALLEECWMLQRRIELEKLASTVTLAEFAWIDAMDADQQPLAQDAATLLAELTTTLDSLKEIDYVLNDLSVSVGKDQIPFGCML